MIEKTAGEELIDLLDEIFPPESSEWQDLGVEVDGFKSSLDNITEEKVDLAKGQTMKFQDGRIMTWDGVCWT
jgi:hypothetical protein